jgi:mono/diheme cytochrome c family protein
MGRVREQGVLKSAKWVRWHEVDPNAVERAGEEVFRVECASCHTVNGYNSIRFAVKGWSETMIDYQLAHLNELKGFMPPFVGTEAERKALGGWLAGLNPRPAGLSMERGSSAPQGQSTGTTGEGVPRP